MIWHLNNTLTRFGNWMLKIFCRLIYKHINIKITSFDKGH